MSDAAPPGYEPVSDAGFNDYVGPIWFKPGAGEAPGHFLFDVREHHLNGGGFLHGGMAMALADVVLGVTVSRAIGGAPCATVSLNCDFTAAGRAGERIEGEARVTRRTRSVVFVSGELFTRGRDGARRTLMTATGIWKILDL
ncbi:MAG: PaaI family thioesterase [Alphaproteobacteria bacterium]